ncbi:MAG: hypothetical protein ABSA04_07660 [Desulfobaccales bacterium]|jgi:hypothetical protein
MREVEKLYLIDQGVVFFREGFEGAGSLGMDYEDQPLLSIDGGVLKQLADHFVMDVEPRQEPRYKDGKRVGHYLVAMGDRDFPLVKRSYREYTAQVHKIEARIEGNVLHVRITNHQTKPEVATWVDEFAYCGKFEVWWKNCQPSGAIDGADGAHPD